VYIQLRTYKNKCLALRNVTSVLLDSSVVNTTHVCMECSIYTRYKLEYYSYTRLRRYLCFYFCSSTTFFALGLINYKGKKRGGKKHVVKRAYKRNNFVVVYAEIIRSLLLE
jgi:hypothetical protein